MNTDRLAEVLGTQFWTAAVTSEQAANEQAANEQAATRMAAGRPAVSFHDEAGNWFVGWGVKNA